MTTKQEHQATETKKTPKRYAGVGQKHARNEERLRDDRGGQVGSGDEREQVDQEEFDRGRNPRRHDRDQAN